MTPRGRVYLVGAGPGDAGLITVRGVECLAKSDVIVYDNLVNESLLEHAPASAERIFAGKRAKCQAMTQERINELLVEKARAGHVVTRLKGGDPFVFGRGGEEAEYLALAVVPFEVVPGVSSAVAVPAYAGIPVTHRNVSAGVTIVTGHYAGDGKAGAGGTALEHDDAEATSDQESVDESKVDWMGLARSGNTLVLLMGVGKLGEIAQQLIRGGRAANTPVAVVRYGTTSDQETLISTLRDVVSDVQRSGIRAPATVVIGEVVRLRETIAWAEQRPLFGVRVAVTRPAEQSASLAAALQARGAEVVVAPTIKTVRRNVRSAMPEIVERLREGQFAWLVFSSASAVRYFFHELRTAEKDARALGKARVAAVGDKTAEVLAEHSIRADVVAVSASQEGLSTALAANIDAGDSVLFPRAAVAREHLEQALRNSGADVHVLPLYDTIADEDGIQRLIERLCPGAEQRVHFVTFTSASTYEKVHEFAAEKGLSLQDLLRSVQIASIGPVTAAALERDGLTVAITAREATAESLAEAIAAHVVHTRTAGGSGANR